MTNHLPFSLKAFDLPLINNFSRQLLSVKKKRIALVVQGGGQRGIFTAGVFDAFLESGFDPFELYIGTSAGALNLSSYISRQPRFGYDFIVNYTTDNEFFNLYKYLSQQKPMNLDWVLDEVRAQGSLPLDVTTAREVLRHRRALACATRKDTLQDIYMPMYKDNWCDVLRASCAIPVIYNQPVNFDDLEWVDGGVSAAVPVKEAWQRGADLVIVIRTEPVLLPQDESSRFDDWRGKVEIALPDYIERLSLNESLDKVKALHGELTTKFESWKLNWRDTPLVKTGQTDAGPEAESINKGKGWSLLSADNIERFLALTGSNKRLEVIDMLNRYYTTYQGSHEFMLSPPEGLQIIQIAPEKGLKSRALLSGKDDLEVDYREGKLIGREFISHFADILNEATAVKR
ncbi:patatin-like phospholipase family protein [Photobacterium lutimaris]|uniref:Patatin family protein n=1 Tax=Photobacterium lutimaris TaxID=388278 RepID=A0A2T3J082_9GAMM|nr:patatin-like phospholipase family protein [Photobacterium lutimaris]PSU34324.1 patatin family protein [Photobacterium lutimaris]TDR75915.1 patatin-like phospholipase [Photobacterium lutimaris]